MLRSALSLVSVVVLTIVCGIPATFLSLVHPRGNWVVKLGRIWARGIAAASGVTVEGRGLENLPRNRPFMLISNHQSLFDMVAFLMTFPLPFRVVAKRFLFRVPVFGWCLYAAGMIPIDREKRAQAIRSLDRAAEKIGVGMPVLLYPEGTRSLDGHLLPFKKGAFVIAVKAGVPIVPVSVAGGYDILSKGSARIRAGHMVIRYGPEIPSRGYTLETKEELLERVRGAVAAGLAEIDPGRYVRPLVEAAGGAAATSI